MLISLALSVSGFYISDTFDTYDSTLYNNVSRLSACDVSVTGGSLRFNGTSCGAGSTSTYFQTKNFIASQMNGNLSFKFKGVTNGNDNDHFKIGAFNMLTGGLYISRDVDQVYSAHDFPGAARLCAGDQKTPDNNWHTIDISIVRGRNSTGYALNTTYTIKYDGASWCTDTQANTINVYANFTDNSASGSGHDYLIDDLVFTDGNYSKCSENCKDPCIFEDYFNTYITDISTCGWLKMPDVNISPSSSKICINSSTGSQRIDAPIGSYGSNNHVFTNKVLTEEFTLTLYPGASIEKTFYQNVNGLPVIYKLGFFDLANVVYMQYFNLDTNNTPMVTSICSNCFAESTPTKIKIVIYSSTATQFSYFNYTTNAFSPELPQTIKVVIGDSVEYGNIPFYDKSQTGAFIPYSTSFESMIDKYCLDDYVIYAGESKTTVTTYNNITLPYLQEGEYCGLNNSICITQWCAYGYCSKKTGGTNCVNGYECISGTCSNNKCSKEGIANGLKQSVAEMTGGTEQDFTIISIIISLAIGMIIIILGRASGWSIFVGGLAFVILIFAFTFLGMISPWVTLAMVIVIIAGIVFISNINGR